MFTFIYINGYQSKSQRVKNSAFSRRLKYYNVSVNFKHLSGNSSIMLHLNTQGNLPESIRNIFVDNTNKIALYKCKKC